MCRVLGIFSKGLHRNDVANASYLLTIDSELSCSNGTRRQKLTSLELSTHSRVNHDLLFMATSRERQSPIQISARLGRTLRTHPHRLSPQVVLKPPQVGPQPRNLSFVAFCTAHLLSNVLEKLLSIHHLQSRSNPKRSFRKLITFHPTDKRVHL